MDVVRAASTYVTEFASTVYNPPLRTYYEITGTFRHEQTSAKELVEGEKWKDDFEQDLFQ